MSVSCVLFSKAGKQLVEAEADVRSVLWRLGETGAAHLLIDYRNAAASRRNLIPGNRIKLSFSNGLPDWGGVVDFPVGRRTAGLDISAYEGSRILSWRISDRDAAYTATAPGEIVQALLEAANVQSDTGILPGEMYDGGSQERSYHFENLLSVTGALGSESGYDYAVVPVYRDARLTFRLHWYEQVGDDRRDSTRLAQGVNVGTVVMDEQGPIYNQVVVVGEGDDWDEDRPMATASAGGSIADYGLRQLAKVYLDISDQATLDAIADALAADLAWPRVRATLGGVINADPGRFSEYNVGDIVTLECFKEAGEWAFEGAVRVLSRQWAPDETCTVEVEQWRD